MINNVEEYLSQLKKELSGSDPATIQDALADAEEHLRTALNGSTGPEGLSENEALASIIDRYGSPAEVAAAYREIESYTAPGFVKTTYREKDSLQVYEEEKIPEPVIGDSRPFPARFFGIVLEPRAWGALLYIFFAFCTGIIYFTWVVTGVSVSVSLIVLIIGLPLAALFILSVWGISLAEGRIVEALLGVRMPRRPLYYKKNMGWLPRFRRMLADKHTWLSLVYMVFQMPLGVIYFTVFTTLISTSLACITLPIWHLGCDVPIVWGGQSHYFVGWFIPIVMIVGIILFFATMHLAKITGQLHGKMAKAMLVRT